MKKRFARSKETAPPPPPELQLHRSCGTLILGAFIKAYCNNDFSGLIIAGKPTDNELQDAFKEILFEYASLFKSSENAFIIDLSKEIGLLQWHITFVQYSVVLLRYQHVQEVIDQLLELGYEGNYDPSDVKAYNAQLDRVVSLCKTRVVDLSELQDQFDRIKKTTDGKNQGEEDFEKNLVMLWKFVGSRVDKNVITVREYVCLFNEFMAQNGGKKA